MCLFRFEAQITEPSPEYAQWLSTVKNVNEIIQFANDFTYISDKEQFGKTDHWQTPSEFFKNKRGDCEDLHLFVSDAIYRTLGWESYLLIGWKWDGFLKIVAHGMTIFNDGKGYRLVDYWNVVPMKKLFDYEALKKVNYAHFGGIFRMPDGKRIRQ